MRLGFAAGYLSKLKAGKDSSATTTALLALLAEAPKRLNELETLWSGEAAQRGPPVGTPVVSVRTKGARWSNSRRSQILPAGRRPHARVI